MIIPLSSIYIIDDDPIVTFGLKKMLGSLTECKNIHSFENGKLALESIIQKLESKQEIPDVIFLDINMPIMDGWGFLEAFHKLKIKKRIRINIITSSIDPSDYQKWERIRQKTVHFLDYKNKPIFKITAQDISYIGLAS